MGYLLSSILTLLLCFSLQAEEVVYYHLSGTEYISEVLNDLGACPLYGKKGTLSKVLSENSEINPDEITPGQKLKIPFELLTDIDMVYFFSGGRVIPKSKENNLCHPLEQDIKEEFIPDIEESEVIAFSPEQVKTRLPSSAIDRRNSKLLIDDISFIERNIAKNEKELQFTVTFNRPVYVRGLPFIFVSLVGQKKMQAKYSSGNGSKSIQFLLKPIPQTTSTNVRVAIPSNYTDFDIVDFEDSPLNPYRGLLKQGKIIKAQLNQNDQNKSDIL